MNSAQHSIDAIVLRVFPFGEADLILRALSPELGKISLLAKHARKSKKRFFGSLDVFDHVLFNARPSRSGLWVIQNFESQNSLRSVRSSLDKISLASLLCESFDVLLHEGNEHNQEYFASLDLCLRALDEAASLKDSLRFVYHTLAHLLTLAGFYECKGSEPPTARNLLRLVQQLERSAEKELATKASMLRVLQRLKDKDARAAQNI